MKLFSLKLR